MAIDSNNFEVDVIQRSQQIPVLVDFWAEWCGPCKSLGPIIESLAAEADGKWELVKLNTEKDPETAQKYKIKSIPALKLFSNGLVIAEMVGALPKNQLSDWIQKHLPDHREEEMRSLMEDFAKNPDDNGQYLKDFARKNPDLIRPRLVLASLSVMSKPKEALEWVEGVKLGQKYFEDAEDIRRVGEFLSQSINGEGEGDVAEKLIASRAAFLASNEEKGIQMLVQAVMADKTFQDDLPRKTCIAFFRLWGPDYPLTLEYRRRFNMALY